MPARIKVFLPFVFDGNPEPNGISNWDVGQWFKREIERLGNGSIDVVATRNPVDSAISEAVKRQIDSADAVICIFSKRALDQVPHKWMTSPYVVSESGYAASRFRYDADKCLFAFIEDGVDRAGLGLAFPGDRTVPPFNRFNLGAVLPDLEGVIQSLLDQTSYASDAPQPLLLHKTVQVRRDGRARIETRFRFRVRKDMRQFRMGHAIWRVRKGLPPLRTMLETAPGDAVDFFRCIPVICGNAEPGKVIPEYDRLIAAQHNKEIGFDVRFPQAPLKAADLIEYLFAYSYGAAFFNNKALAEWEKNSTGMRTGGRGAVGRVILTVMFERNWHGPERVPAVEPHNGDTGPRVARACN